jgi:hypothetical protein
MHQSRLDKSEDKLLSFQNTMIFRRRNAYFACTSLLIGAVCTGTICAMAAWDLAYPPEPTLGNLYGRGPCGFEEPIGLLLWRKVVKVDQTDSYSGTERVCSNTPEANSSAGGFRLEDSWWQYDFDYPLCDRVSVTTLTPASETPGMERPNFGAFCRWMRMQSQCRTDQADVRFQLPDELLLQDRPEAVGTPPKRWGSSALWGHFRPSRHRSWESRTPPYAPTLEPDSVIDAAARTGHIGRRVYETRVYGWPLRCLWIKGVREQEWRIAWGVDDFGEGAWSFVGVIYDRHWTSAALDFTAHSNWSCDAELPPASGIPWQPVWGAFLANTIVIGVPIRASISAISYGWPWLRALRKRKHHKCEV